MRASPAVVEHQGSVETVQLPYDVPLPAGLIQAHPEPLLIDRNHDESLSQPAAQGSACMADGLSCAVRCLDSGTDDSTGSMPFCNAEPMTAEEAEAFDLSLMGACFLNFGGYTANSGCNTDSSPAEQAAEAMATLTGQPSSSKISKEQAQQQHQQLQQCSGSTGNGKDSNRSSFDEVPAALQSGQQQQQQQEGSMSGSRSFERSWGASSARGQQQHVQNNSSPTAGECSRMQLHADANEISSCSPAQQQAQSRPPKHPAGVEQPRFSTGQHFLYSVPAQPRVQLPQQGVMPQGLSPQVGSFLPHVYCRTWMQAGTLSRSLSLPADGAMTSKRICKSPLLQLLLCPASFWYKCFRAKQGVCWLLSSHVCRRHISAYAKSVKCCNCR